jgi:pentatricopeptide repeat domain-containing protein 1
VLRACDRKERWQEALALLSRMSDAGLRPTLLGLESALRCCSKAGQLDMAIAVWDMLRTEMAHPTDPLRPSIRTYNTLMRTLADRTGSGSRDVRRRKATTAVLEAFDEACAQGLPLDDAAYKHALRACDLLGDADRALELFDGYRAAGFRPDVLVFSNVMSACARTGRMEQVFNLLSEMRAAGLQPNAFCYNSGMIAATRAHRLPQALQLLREMEGEAHVSPTKHTYAALLRACSAAGDWRTALQLLRRMERMGIEFEAVHYGLAINACSRAGENSKVGPEPAVKKKRAVGVSSRSTLF